MRGKLLSAFLLTLLTFGLTLVTEASGLSQNSGINPSDSHVSFDLTIHGQSTWWLSQPVYDARTNTTTSNPTLNRVTRYRVEAGYDANGELVLNVFSADVPEDPNTASTDGLLLFRLARGKLVVFDEDGKPLPVVLPNGAPLPDPLQFLGPRPGSSVLNGVVIADPYSFAQERAATIEIVPSQAAPGSPGSPTVAQVTAPASEGGNTVWTFQQAGNVWTLNAVNASFAEPNGNGSQLMQLSNLSWYSNSSVDASRASQGSTAQEPPATSSDLSLGPLTNPTSETARIDPGCATSSNGQNVLFQHGLFSDCGTWHRMHPWLREKFQLGTVLIPSLPSTNRIFDQGTDLFNLMNASGHSNFIMMGHSQGGLIARDVTQRSFAAGLPLSRGVITANTPHNGAILALTTRAGAAAGLEILIFNLARNSCSGFPNPGCFLAGFLAGTAPFALNHAFDAIIPSSNDLIPQSQYLQGLNSNVEGFTRVGVEGHTRRRWVLMRLGGDVICNPESGCGGRAFVTFTRISYFSLRACQILGFFFPQFTLGRRCGRIANIMDAIDLFWNFLLTSVPGDGTDGIVQTSSQRYPGATARYPVNNADSHLGATRSDKTRSAFELALQNNFLVARVGCSFSISPASASLSANPSNGSFTITTAAGCGWSAVPSESWIRITAGMTGNTSSTISFSLDANFSPLPRSGSIAVGGRTFAINQAGATGCIFALSPTSATASRFGGSGAVSVTTQAGCIWSATTTTPWITVTAGSTGTGTGTFSYSVASNPDTPRAGTILVNGSVFTVTQAGINPPPDDPNCRTRVCP